MRRIAVAVAAVVALSGCLTMSEFDRNLAAFHGQPVSAAFDILGYPDLQQQFGTETVYTWANTGRRRLPVPVAQTTTGTAGGVPFAATSTGVGTIELDAACKVKLVVDPDGIVRKHQYDGTDLGCEGYMRRLYKAARE